MKLFARACLAVSLALVPIACGDDEKKSASATCGNDTIEGAEECDGTDVGGQTCEDLMMGSGTGTPTCASDCTFDLTSCGGAGGSGGTGGSPSTGGRPSTGGAPPTGGTGMGGMMMSMGGMMGTPDGGGTGGMAEAGTTGGAPATGGAAPEAGTPDATMMPDGAGDAD